ncbi:MAG: hypothetical protein LBN04_00540 [Oscillospiraceae bacterium]|jgi:hypothetical protein|nr:hypothetical protein [Oscillospiraceae bacterium]
MKRLCVVLLAVLMLCVAGFAARGEEIRYYNEKYGLSLPIPEGWVQVPVSADVADVVDLQLEPAGDEGFMIFVAHKTFSALFNGELTPEDTYFFDVLDLPPAALADGIGLPESAIERIRLHFVSYYQVDFSPFSNNGYYLVALQNDIMYQYYFLSVTPERDATYEAYYADFMAMVEDINYLTPNPSSLRIYSLYSTLAYIAAFCALILLHIWLPRWLTLGLFRITDKYCTIPVLLVNAALWRIVFGLLAIPRSFNRHVAFALAPHFFWYIAYIVNYFYITAALIRAEDAKKAAERPPLDPSVLDNFLKNTEE